MTTQDTVRLRPGRDRPVRLRHPWVLSGSVDRIEGEPEPGETVSVVSSEGELLGTGDYDPQSQIRVRLFTFGPEPADPAEGWLESRLTAALDWRSRHPLLADTNATRLVHGEADGLPGLMVDRYAEWLVLKVASPGMLRRAERVARHLADHLALRGAWLRGDLSPGTAPPTVEERAVVGEVPETPIPIEERGRRYRVDLRRGQKTGFYLDQRESRDLFRALAAGKKALDLFAYTGGFCAAALQGGAREVVAVESSEPALELLRENAPAAEAVSGDAHEFLRSDRRRFDLVVCDPPPLARRRRDVSAACRAYKDINLGVLRHVEPGAHVLTFTCSHHIDADLFRKVVFGAAMDAGAGIQWLATLGAAPDHPVSLHHPQGEYLKGLLLRIVEPGR
jgi:23S rRNA (cytosine1962-C5)-methyltransferase